MDTIEIRDATLSDISNLLVLENSCFKHPWTEKDLIYELNGNPVSMFAVLEFNKELIGFYDYWHTFDSATIAQICVLPKYQKNHFGSKLLEEIISDCYAKKVINITLEVRANNFKAIGLYKKYGFKEITRKPQYYTDGEDAIYMVRSLN